MPAADEGRRVSPADGKILLTGDLSLHGVSREVAVRILFDLRGVPAPPGAPPDLVH